MYILLQLSLLMFKHVVYSRGTDEFLVVNVQHNFLII